MYLIQEKKQLTENVSLMKIKAPFVVKHAKVGQFIMLRVDSKGERIPLTIVDANPENGLVTIIYQVVGATTRHLNRLNEGQYLTDFLGPLGKPTDLNKLNHALVIGGGVGCAIAYPIALALKEQNTNVDTIIGFRNQSFIFLENEFKEASSDLFVMTDDGSYGERGLVTDKLETLLQTRKYDKVFVIGPLVMMKAVSERTRKDHIPTLVSMNPIMVDGTGMCGGCRVVYDGKMKFACVDGPDFDGHKVDFDDAIRRNKMYHEYEKQQDEHRCKLAGEFKHDQ